MQSGKQFRGITFNVGHQYQLQKLVGSGAYGHVAVAYDKRNGAKVAVKKLNKIDDQIDAKRILREILIQRKLKHTNLLRLLNCIYDNTTEDQMLGDIYLISQYYPADLGKIIKSGQKLTVEHIQYIMYQLCKGVFYLHSAQIIHRDIKPGNILATENCEVCLCDFGFARTFAEQENNDEDQQMTEYVVTRYYRAPEIMLSSQQYTKAVDIWSLGCTFAELMTGKVLFKGSNYIQMIKIIFELLGKPDEKDLADFINNENAQVFVDSLPNTPRRHISQIISYSNEDALDLLNSMLEPNPTKRITVQGCLDHPFFSKIRLKKDEISFQGQLNCDYFESDEDISFEQIQELILSEINEFRILFDEPLIDIDTEISRLKLNSMRLDEDDHKDRKEI